ncbi:ABC transporter ATP-binding protein [Profundibacter amoris]|uniref:ABC transporter ATP-binding protein n=1 Tax=Profundibacter amoris TaxID=2171755 RepID=A0A347UIU4_9RHOB|nr:ABC transporter ATP-binding protein [Profundibacter amoris]
MAAVTLLSTRDLCRHFGGLRAVRDVDFDLPQGEIRALIGPNGAGKTTFVSMLCGRIPASSGTITFQGQDVTHLPAHKRISLGMAYTFQITSIFGNLTVYENVALAVQHRLGRDHAALKRETLGALARVGLKARAEQVAGDLAYGHQRLLEIAMGLGQEPKLLILDEPTQGLSDGEIEEFIALIREVSANTTVLLIEHNIPVVMALADTITVLNFGRIIAEGTPAEIRANMHVQEAYLGG